MATYDKYEAFVENFANKLIDAFGSTDTWKAVIHTDDPNLVGSSGLADLTEIDAANGYTTGGMDIGLSSTRTAGIVTSTAVDVTWTATGGNLGDTTEARYFSIYDDTSTGDLLMVCFDYGVPFTVADGETMTIDFGTSLWTLQ